MSDLMDDAVMGMPYELAMGSELSRLQFYNRAQSLYRELQAARAQPAAEPKAADIWRARHTPGYVFAGWFNEQKSGMSYRLWEQGGHDREPGDVALYEEI